MADLRKWLYTFVAVALLAGLSVPANAQTLIQCAPNPNNPLVHAEGYTELAGDIFITCTGGTPTALGSQVPKVTITVFASTPITSKLTDTSQNPAFNEALLIVDEAGAVGSANAILNCGSAAAPYGPTPFTCDTASPSGTGAGIYDGTAGHPNIFQGRQVNNSGGQAIQFIGVPIDAPGSALINGIPPVRTLRITNVRVNAAALNVSLSQGFSIVTVNATVAFNGANFGGNQISNVLIATVRPGLVVAGQINSSPANFLQCTANSGNAANNINLTEGFPASFKVRNWRQIQDNGIRPTIAGGGWTWSGGSLISTIDLNQNVPNALFETESGMMFPPGAANPVPNPPTGASSGTWPGGQPFSDVGGIGGIEQAGTASQGTRFAIKFSTIPVGSNPSVPLIVPFTGGTGVMVLVCGTDAAGAGGVPGSCTATTGAGFPGNTMRIPANGLVVYEVAFSDPFAIDSASINVSVSPTINANANPPLGGSPQVSMTAQAVAGFAPFYAASSSAGGAQLMSSTLIAASPASLPPIPASAPIPRFRDDLTGQIPINLFSYTPCTTLDGLISAKSGPTNARDWTITAFPITPVSVNDNAQITGLTLRQTFGAACTPVIATPFPVSLGQLLPGLHPGHIIIDFSGCPAVARFTAVLSFSSSSGSATGSKTLFNQYR